MSAQFLHANEPKFEETSEDKLQKKHIWHALSLIRAVRRALSWAAAGHVIMPFHQLRLALAAFAHCIVHEDLEGTQASQ